MNETNDQIQFEGTANPSDMDELLTRLGHNVRSARAAKRMPRRVLSDLSGVSPRYLAQLESGQGNISITLLSRVAIALDRSLLEILGDEATQEELRLVDLFRTADANTRAGVMHRLEQAAPGPDRAQRVCLIGLRGAGKSTLGKAAGARLSVPFVELNAEIEQQAGMPVSEIMALYGADGYRQLEAEAIRRVSNAYPRAILAASGGVVSEPDTYETLLGRFHTVWVRANPDDHMARVRAQGDMRPMQGQPEAMVQLRGLLEGRSSEYARANAQLNTSGRTLERSVSDLLELISDRGFLV